MEIANRCEAVIGQGASTLCIDLGEGSGQICVSWLFVIGAGVLLAFGIVLLIVRAVRNSRPDCATCGHPNIYHGRQPGQTGRRCVTDGCTCEEYVPSS